MFTGLIQKIGTVKRISRGAGTVVEIAASSVWERPLESGESVAVNGVCLTVVKADATRFTADILKETEDRSTLAGIAPGTKVNLERALRAGDAMGGHVVQGHVDAIGTVEAILSRGRDFRLRIQCGRVFASYCVMKGSVAIDGVSLTVSGLGDDWLTVDIIPTTAGETTLGAKKVGDKVNLESDVFGRYAAKKVGEASGGTLTEDMLAKAGFLD